MIKHLPNLLSLLRMALSVTFVFLIRSPDLYLTVYLLCGATDVLDGAIARKYGLQSDLGAELDSLADALFIAAQIICLFLVMPSEESAPVLTVVLVITAMKLAGLLLVRIKFRRWGSVHTLLNKATGAVLFVLLPAFVLLGAFPPALTVPLCALAFLTALEEWLIVFRFDTYDANRRSFFSKR
ncbi:MAG: CDP-alcohol phosphatidyltransferase family protein [Christensenellales bacterium]